MAMGEVSEKSVQNVVILRQTMQVMQPSHFVVDKQRNMEAITLGKTPLKEVDVKC